MLFSEYVRHHGICSYISLIYKEFQNFLFMVDSAKQIYITYRKYIILAHIDLSLLHLTSV